MSKIVTSLEETKIGRVYRRRDGGYLLRIPTHAETKFTIPTPRADIVCPFLHLSSDGCYWPVMDGLTHYPMIQLRKAK